MVWATPPTPFKIFNKQKCHFFFHLQNRRTGGQNRSCLGSWYQWERGGRGEKVKEGEYGTNCVHLYINGKLSPVETLPGMVGELIKENGGGGEFKYDIL
jgi:hypothetical protein